MNAEQMFEELGYEKKEESEGFLLYISDFENSILFEKKRVTITDLYCYGTITININCLLENAIHKQCEELGWLEEEKRATNFEHYFEYLSEKRMMDFALIDGRVTKCSVTQCSECDFNHDCIEGKFKWLKQLYKKPTYQLTRFEFDLIKTFDRCKECCLLNEVECLKKLIEKGYFKGINPFTKVHEILDNCEVK